MDDGVDRCALRMVAVAVTTGLLACGGALGDARGSDSADDPAPHVAGGLVGNPAPNFSAKAIGSKETVLLRKLRGQVVLVDFWGTFCEPCKKSFPKLQQLSHEYSAQGFQVVAISEDEADDKDKIPGFAATYGAKFTIAWDQDRSIAHAYNPETMPSSFLVDKRGIVRFVHVGYHDGQEAELRREIQELLAK
jgi:cytochrome c biogenesis protein CcmG/thiol:disulfide interchange protein DsbE